MKIIRPFLLAAALAVMVTAGCARADDSAPSSSPSSAPAPSASAPTTELPATDLPLPSKGGPGETGAQTITGKVTAGVEPGCVLVAGHLLIFDDPALKSQAAEGAEVVVTGRADPSMMTTCQQGTPFVVTDVRPA